MEYDESCPAPPAPYHPCDEIGPLRKAEAKAICGRLTGRYICDQYCWYPRYSFIRIFNVEFKEKVKRFSSSRQFIIISQRNRFRSVTTLFLLETKTAVP